jgi:hypothetical protein
VPLQLTRLQSTLKSEYRAGGDSLISTDSQECRTVQSHVGLPRWQPPVHEKDTATSSPPVQILHKAEGPDSKNNQPRFVSKKNPIVFLVREREKKTVNSITFRSTCPTYFYRPFLPIRILQSKIPILSYVALVLHFRFQILLIISAIVVFFPSAQKNLENLQLRGKDWLQSRFICQFFSGGINSLRFKY